MSNQRPPCPIRIIIDSNVFIDLENHGEKTTTRTRDAARLAQAASEVHAPLVLADDTRQDLLRSLAPLREKRIAQMEKYTCLPPPYIPDDLATKAGFPKHMSANDRSDLGILAALDAGAADWLVTEDVRLRRRAARVGLGEHVFSIFDAVQTLRAFAKKAVEYPSLVEARGPQLKLGAPIFQSIRKEYPEFDLWWKQKVCRDDRTVLVVGKPSDPQGLSVLKIEADEQPHGLHGRVLKICTFKIDEQYEGSRRGELLLAGSLEYARANDCSLVYLEVLPYKQPLIDWAVSFGFSKLEGATTARDEIILVKDLIGSTNPPLPMSALDYNIAHGPGRLLLQNPVVVPIKGDWRRRLLPARELQPSLPALNEPCGNAIRKAYLCHAPIRSLAKGDTLLFYETKAPSGPQKQGRGAVVSLGVVESTLVSGDPALITRVVGNRTVYSPTEILQLCSRGDVLAIRFRHDRVLKFPWSHHELVDGRVFKRAPQTIMRVKGKGVEWIRTRLAE